MKITDLRIDGFGVWNTMSAGDLSQRVTLFYGPNEAGKTTLMQFVRTVLYGFSGERRRLYLPPVHGGEPGGSLGVINHNGSFTIERNGEEDSDELGRLLVHTDNGGRQGQHLLNVLLHGIDESIFNNVFAVGIRELQELATLNDTQAATHLYDLASGVDRVSLVEVMRSLDAERAGIWAGEGQPSELEKLFGKREKLVREIEGLEQQTRRWADLAVQQRSLVNEVETVEERIEQLAFDTRTAELAIQVRDKWKSRAEVDVQLNEIGEVDPLPDDALDRIDEINFAIAEQREHLRPLKERRQSLRRELAGQPINHALWDQSCRIEALCEHGPWLSALDSEIGRLVTDIEESEVELLQIDEQLAASGGVQLSDSVVVTDHSFQQLLPPATALREAIKKRTIAHNHHKKSRQEKQTATEELLSSLDGRKAEDFDDAIDQKAEEVRLLRKRIELDSNLERMWQHSSELEDDNNQLLDSQLQRVRLFAVIGVIFACGGGLALTGMFGANLWPMSLEIRWIISFLGLFLMGISSAWKLVLEKTAQDELNDCFDRRQSLERDIEKATEDCQEIDRQLPSVSGTLTTRLSGAEKELKELEALAPRQHDRQQASRRTDESKRYARNASEELREAKSRWRRALRHVGLPETLTPKHVKQLNDHHQARSKIQDRLDEKRDRHEQLQSDREVLVERLQKLNEDIGISTVSDDPQVQLSQLATALSGQREMVDRRRELHREEKQVRRELSQGLKQLRKWSRSAESLFAESRVTDEEELRERAEELKLLAELNSRHDTLSEQIRAIIGKHCTEEEMGEVLEEHTREQLDSRFKTLTTRLDDARESLNQLIHRHGEVTQEMKSLSENRRLAAAKFELGCIEEHLDKASARWRVVAVTLRMLEEIRESYEAERQPETLGEASLYLQQLTEGKYSRIWTPLGRNELRVDDADGQPLSLDILSRGTREAIFLSLRLALVAAYGRRGINIPMILDDVLVNLDIKRARSAVALLCDFAKEGRQLLFFTCHEHIKEMFMEADVDIRVLPAHGVPGTRIDRLQWQPQPVEVSEPEEILLEDADESEEEDTVLIETPAEEPEEELAFAVAEAEPEVDPEPEPTVAIEEYVLQAPVPIETPQLDLSEFAGHVDVEPITDDIESAFDEEDDDEGSWWWESRSGVPEEEPAA